MTNRKRILLVDDDADVRAIITAFLLSKNYEVIEANNVSSAVGELTNSVRFDLAILDFWLGKDNSVPILEATIADGRKTPVIMISGGNRDLDLEATEAISHISGAKKFLQKPFQKATLLESVAFALKGDGSS